MYKLRYLSQARADLLRIRDYIAVESGNREIAVRYTDKLREQCRKLAAINGTIGQSRPELRANIRSFPMGNYVIFFRYDNACLEIVTIIEGHRDIERMFHN